MRIFSDMNKLSGGDSIKLGCFHHINQKEALKKSILIICTGNSCRSQMAEGFIRKMGMTTASAGTHPEKNINPYTVKVMQEIGIDISGHKPKYITDLDVTAFDILLTVCSDARDNCPVIPGYTGELIHQPFDDPAKAVENKLAMYRRVRDEIGMYLEEIFKSEIQSN